MMKTEAYEACIIWTIGWAAHSISPDLRSVSMLPVANSDEYPSFRAGVFSVDLSSLSETTLPLFTSAIEARFDAIAARILVYSI